MTAPVQSDEREKFEEEREKFREVLRGIRAEQKVTQAQLARSMNVTQQTAARFESGERRMDMVELRHWCVAVGVPFEEVVRRFLDKVQGLEKLQKTDS